MRVWCAVKRCCLPSVGKLFCLALLAAAVVPGSVGIGAAADVSLIASVDKTEATVDDFFLLTIQVEGVRVQPALDSVRDFEVQSRGSSTQMRIVNGQMSSSVEYTYLLRPRAAGRFMIGPFSVSLGGKRYQSNTIELTVSEQSRQQRTESTREYFVTATVDNPAPYQYQQILYTFSFYRSVSVANATLVERPSFDGFLVEDLGREREREQVINGRRYVVTELRQVLFPTRTGTLRIEPSRLQCDVVKRRRRGFPNGFFLNDPFGGFNETEPASLRTDGIDIQVRMLPVDGKPDGFQDLVGQFQLRVNVSARQVAVGESATVTLTLAGRGNLQTLGTIELPGSSAYKIYDDKPVFEPDATGDVFGGTLTVKKAIVPLVPGTLHIAPLSVAYFDPTRTRYTSAVTGPIEIDVVPGEESEQIQPVGAGATAPVKQEVVVLGQDLVPVRSLPRALVPDRYRVPVAAALAAFVAPILLFAGVVAGRRLRGQGESQRLRAGARKAHARFRKQTRDARKHLHSGDAAFYQCAGKAVRDFVADKHGLARGGAQTAEDIARQLDRAGVPEELISGLREVLQFCDRGQFGYERHGEDEKRKKLEGLCDMIARLNRRL